MDFEADTSPLEKMAWYLAYSHGSWQPFQVKGLRLLSAIQLGAGGGGGDLRNPPKPIGIAHTPVLNKASGKSLKKQGSLSKEQSPVLVLPPGTVHHRAPAPSLPQSDLT